MHVEPLRLCLGKDETYSTVAKKLKCLTQVIDGDSLILPDNVADKLK